MKSIKTALVGLVAATLAVGIVGCSSDDSSNNTQAAAFDDSSQSTCFTQLDTNQAQQMRDMAQKDGNTAQNAGVNADGTQDICVLENDGNGGYREHYYGQNDGFSDYLLYSMMFGRSNSLVGFGLLSGAIDPMDAIILGSLSSVNSYGQPYHPYSYNNGQGWGRQSTVISNSTVNVYYGKDPKPVSYKDSVTHPRAGYKPTKPVPAASDKVANGTTRTAKPVAKPGASATSVIGAKPTVKNNAPGANVPNPKKTSSPGASSAPTQKKPSSTSGGGSGSKPKSGSSSGGSKHK